MPKTLESGTQRTFWEIDGNNVRQGPYRVEGVFHMSGALEGFGWETDRHVLLYHAAPDGTIINNTAKRGGRSGHLFTNQFAAIRACVSMLQIEIERNQQAILDIMHTYLETGKDHE